MLTLWWVDPHTVQLNSSMNLTQHSVISIVRFDAMPCTNNLKSVSIRCDIAAGQTLLVV